MSKQKENEFRIETEIAKNLAKYWYEKLEAKAVEVICATGLRESRAVRLHDIASILDQLPEPEKQPDITAEIIIKEAERFRDDYIKRSRGMPPSGYEIIEHLKISMEQKRKV